MPGWAFLLSWSIKGRVWREIQNLYMMFVESKVRNLLHRRSLYLIQRSTGSINLEFNLFFSGWFYKNILFIENFSMTLKESKPFLKRIKKIGREHFICEWANLNQFLYLVINYYSYQSSTLCFPPFFHQLSLLAIFVHELSLLPSSMHSVTQSLKCCLCLFIQALYEVLKHLDKVVFELYLNFIQIFNKKTHLIQI